MRIAISGAHHTGKTTLIEELLGSLPSFSAVAEPYHQLAEEGHAFSEMPSIDDFERQLERSIESILDSDGDCLFDRCPADILSYLVTHDDSAVFDADLWYSRIHDAMQQLDLVVFVPIETPDRVGIPESESGDLRQRVDEELRDIVLGDRWALDFPAIEVTGSPAQRAHQVLSSLDEKS